MAKKLTHIAEGPRIRVNGNLPPKMVRTACGRQHQRGWVYGLDELLKWPKDQLDNYFGSHFITCETCLTYLLVRTL